MRTDFFFFIKASSEDFELDREKYAHLDVYQTSRFAFITNESIAEQGTVRVRSGSETGQITIEIGSKSLFSRSQPACLMVWDSETSTLSVELDELGLFNAFYCRTQKAVFVSNRSHLLERVLEEKAVSSEAVRFFLLAGFLPPDKTFWRDIRRVNGKSLWSLGANQEQHTASRWAQYARESTLRVSERDVLDALKADIQLIEEEVAPQTIRISGGSDSRIVSQLWKTISSGREITAETVQSPWMTRGTDLDVNLAEAWARHLGIPYRVLTPDAAEFAFFMNQACRPYLSGLWGGEFLGGEFLRVVPSQPDEWRRRAQDMRIAIEFSDDWLERVESSEREWFAECASLFLHSSRTTIYGSQVNSWADPVSLTFQTVSPFAGPNFLKVFLRTTREELDEYRMYEKVFRAIGGELAGFPLSSVFVDYLEDRSSVSPFDLASRLRASAEWGVDPKSCRPRPAGGPGRGHGVSPKERLCRDNEEYAYGLSAYSIEALWGDTRTRTNVMALQSWMRRLRPDM
ncbi:MAG: hypothetical protein RBT63_00305 [Bdellovibrionales bacterium]|jgi:hypothetical protein|nr:hypothetical protein [Bdellovibrionales bacterium]